MPDPIASSIDQLTKHWDRQASEAANDCARVDASRRAQRMRFENFAVHHDLAGASVLDIGCGVGDFFEHLQLRPFHGSYLGVDISEAMISRSHERFPAGAFEVRNVLDWTPSEPFDYTVAFAIHNVRIPGSDDLLRQITRRQFDLCRRAAHVSLLTDRYRGFAPHILPWRAEEVLSLALEITPYVVLRHDYLPNDFSVTLYREPLIDTRRDLLLD
jgi:SAM-dependent methyltransferase